MLATTGNPSTGINTWICVAVLMCCTCLALPVAVLAQAVTALEQQCYDAVQGKVAWNRSGGRQWQEPNLRNLCRGTVDPSATVACFQAEVQKGYDWTVGIVSCTGFQFLDEDTQEGATLGAKSAPLPWLSTIGSDWMAKLPDNLRVADLSIPGTHDSGTFKISVASGARTQSWTIRAHAGRSSIGPSRVGDLEPSTL
jgi:hypothetical protein